MTPKKILLPPKFPKLHVFKLIHTVHVHCTRRSQGNSWWSGLLHWHFIGGATDGVGFSGCRSPRQRSASLAILLISSSKNLLPSRSARISCSNLVARKKLHTHKHTHIQKNTKKSRNTHKVNEHRDRHTCNSRNFPCQKFFDHLRLRNLNTRNVFNARNT